MRANSAADAARAVFVISMGSSPFARTLEMANGVEELLAARFGEIDLPHLLASVDDQCIWSADLQLLLNQRAVSQGLNHVPGIKLRRGRAACSRSSVQPAQRLERCGPGNRLSRNAQCVRGQGLSVEWLAGKVLQLFRLA